MATSRKNEVTNLGDATEPKVLASYDSNSDLQPLSQLPAGYEVLATRHPTAKGFTMVGDQVALQF